MIKGWPKWNECPLRRVVHTELYWTGNPHQLGPGAGFHFRMDTLECGHALEIRGHLKERARRRCYECVREYRRQS